MLEMEKVDRDKAVKRWVTTHEQANKQLHKMSSRVQGLELRLEEALEVKLGLQDEVERLTQACEWHGLPGALGLQLRLLMTSVP